MLYFLSSNDDSSSISFTKSNKHRENINHSNKYIQPKNNDITGTDLHTKIQNFTSRQKKIIITTRPPINPKQQNIKSQKKLVTTHRTIKNTIKNSNNSNINIQNNNSTDNSQNDGRYGNYRHNKNNVIRRGKQSIKKRGIRLKNFKTPSIN